MRFRRVRGARRKLRLNPTGVFRERRNALFIDSGEET